MDDLNRPLGKKPAPDTTEPGGNTATRTNALLAVALVAAVAALGLVSWQVFSPKPDVVALKIPDVVEVVPAEPQTEDTEEPIEDGINDTTDLGPDADGEGMRELEADTRIAVPEPRPVRAEPQEAGLAHLPDPELTEAGATGVIPKVSADGRRPMDVYAREPDTTGNFGVARVVIIIGGIGISQTASQKAVRDLPPAVTLGFSPAGNSLMRWMQAARKKGHELVLQVPMEPFGAFSSAGNARFLTTDASALENLTNLHWSMSRITNYVGVMNFQGGKLLASADDLKPVFDDIARRGLLFIDDGTSGANQAQATARSALLPFARAHLVLDSTRSRGEIAKQLEALAAEAKRTGVAIGVSNGFPETIEMVAEFARKANENGIEITPISAVVSDPQG